MHFSEANRLRILYFLVFCCTAAWLPIFADFLRERGMGGLRIGLLLGITPALMFLVQPFYGMLADRWGYRRALLLSSALAAVCYAAFLFSKSFLSLCLITAAMSVFYNAIQPILDSLSLGLAQRDRHFSYGSLRLAGSAGWAFTGILTGFFIEKINTTVIFVVSSVSMFLTFLFALTLPATLKSETADAPTETAPPVRLTELLKDKMLIFILLSAFAVSVGTSAVYYFYSIYMKENGASAQLVGFALSFQGLCEIPFFYFSARIIARVGIRTTLLITVFASALRMILYATVRTPVFAVPIELLQGVCWSLFWVVCVEYVNRLVREDARATGQSLLYAAFLGAGAIVGNLWTGWLFEAQMRLADIYFLNASIVAVIGCAMGLFLWKNTE